MSRIHKYRAWDTRRKKMWSAEEMGRDQLTLSPDGRGFINVHGTSTRLSTYLDHLIPLQFTGLKDKNGVALDWWEGDLFELFSECGLFEIVMHCGCFCFSSLRSHMWRIPCSEVLWWHDLPMKLGNIHEHPELLGD